MRRILVVDDDPHICLAIRVWLKRYDFRVSIADGGANGLAAVANAISEPQDKMQSPNRSRGETVAL